ncbi:hypothetical protein [Parenemella sanctibonifatiensis]|nr:hypothetical protein [Parenemella sanctibonifatiensis]
MSRSLFGTLAALVAALAAMGFAWWSTQPAELPPATVEPTTAVGTPTP